MSQKRLLTRTKAESMAEDELTEFLYKFYVKENPNSPFANHEKGKLRSWAQYIREGKCSWAWVEDEIREGWNASTDDYYNLPDS